MNKHYQVYVIRCTAKSGRETIHVGVAHDALSRMQDHQKGWVKATRGRDIAMVGFSRAMPQGDALRMEMKLKSMPPAEKVKWALSGGSDVKGLE